MREIIFRGRPTASVLNEEDLQDCMFDIIDGFVYGNLIADEHEPTIVGKVVDSDWDYCSMEWWCPVVKETVGQFTGLLDKHGRKIFENDILCANTGDKWESGVHSKYLQYAQVVYNSQKARFEIFGKLGESHKALDQVIHKYHATVVGNIYNNPDLMKEITK